MTTRVEIAPSMLRWARERAKMELEELELRFKKLPEWEAGELMPTLKQLESFAKAVHVPLGYLFLPEPPKEQLPIPDFRTVDNRKVTSPSPNLLDMVYACQERQAWYRDHARINQQTMLPFIGNATLREEPENAADKIRRTLGFDRESRAECKTWEDALRLMIRKAEEVGILVMVSGVVFSNNNRKLDTKEFRGFALADPLAPLIFINGSDSKSGQMFTLAHELAHLWLNASGISNAGANPLHHLNKEEVWCNAVAAELLVPLDELTSLLRNEEEVEVAATRLQKYFKVSKLVMLRRLLDANWLKQSEFEQAWAREKARLSELAERSGSGGDFYRTTISRVSRRFTQAVVGSTLEGHTLYRDAFRMLGVSKTSTFNNLGREVGAML